MQGEGCIRREYRGGIGFRFRGNRLHPWAYTRLHPKPGNRTLAMMKTLANRAWLLTEARLCPSNRGFPENHVRGSPAFEVNRGFF